MSGKQIDDHIYKKSECYNIFISQQMVILSLYI